MPLSSENLLFEVLRGPVSLLFRNFSEVLILGCFFVYFCGFRASLGAHWLPKWSHLEHPWGSNSGELVSAGQFGLPGGSKTSKGSLLGAFWEPFGNNLGGIFSIF